MQYRNNVRYEGVYGGVSVTFTLENFSERAVEHFNELLVREAVKSIENREGQCSRVLS
jgi:hypothetical protein